MDGLRTSRTDGTKTYSYVYNGGTLSQMTVGSDTLNFTYDASGRPLSVTLNGTTYYYVTNLQGDVTAILNASGTAVVTYTYDAWGNPLTVVGDLATSGDLATTLGTLNPLRYRGYVYDTETELYYLQSRYYDPQIGRFLDADAFTSTGQGLLGNNMFAYCLNNPCNYRDPSGKASKIIFGDTFDVLNMPWEDSGSGGGPRTIYVNRKAKSEYAAVEESVKTSAGRTKTAKIASVEVDALNFGPDHVAIFSFDFTLISLDLLDENWELSFFDLVNASAELGFRGWMPYAGVMVSLWEPSFTADFGGTSVTITVNIGSYGLEAGYFPDGVKVGFSNVIGLSVAVS